MADFVDEHMGDDLAQGLLMLDPIIEDRPAIEEHHVGHLPGDLRLAAMHKADALEETHDVEFALGAKRAQNVFGREIFDADDEIVAEPPEFFREPTPGGIGQNFKIGK